MKKVHLMVATGALVLPIALTQPAFGADERDRGDAAMDADRNRGVDADNTGRNARDAEGNTLTPMDQGESEADRTITQQIRKSVVDNDSLSTNAKNVKIITQNGVVTLRGPVKSPEEKAAIANAAQKAAGVKRVDNQLEIETN
jgi:osmotically-inducible protein OsmY